MEKKHRVKLYRLEDDAWLDQGTGYLICVENECSHMLMMHEEQDEDKIIYKTPIIENISYEMQNGKCVYGFHTSVSLLCLRCHRFRTLYSLLCLQTTLFYGKTLMNKRTPSLSKALMVATLSGTVILLQF